MKRYYELYYQADIKLQRSVALLPWGHNILLIDKSLSIPETLFYAEECSQKGWSRDMLLNTIKMNTYANYQINYFTKVLFYPKLYVYLGNF